VLSADLALYDIPRDGFDALVEKAVHQAALQRDYQGETFLVNATQHDMPEHKFATWAQSGLDLVRQAA
jgi:hypothetical protein